MGGSLPVRGRLRPAEADRVVERLLRSPEPAVRYKVRVGVLGDDPASRAILRLRDEIRRSACVRRLLSKRGRGGRLAHSPWPYAKWQGVHWVLATLADIGYPDGDESLRPVADQVLKSWLTPYYYREFLARDRKSSYAKSGIPLIAGRYRRCASQQGNALFAVARLGLGDDRVHRLVERLEHWQWPDGGWNCDRRPKADTSSFMETLTPMRGLAAYAKRFKDARAAGMARRAAEVFLCRRMYLRRSTGTPIHESFTKLHYPAYYHYDILAGLKVMAEAGFIRDPRCEKALDLLESKRLPDGWPAEARHYRLRGAQQARYELIDWGPTGARRANEWVAADALTVLAASGRLTV